MPKADLSATGVARIAGISYPTPARWLDEDIVTCDVPAAGAGSRISLCASAVQESVLQSAGNELSNLSCGEVRGARALLTGPAEKGDTLQDGAA